MENDIKDDKLIKYHNELQQKKVKLMIDNAQKDEKLVKDWNTLSAIGEFESLHVYEMKNFDEDMKKFKISDILLWMSRSKDFFKKSDKYYYIQDRVAFVSFTDLKEKLSCVNLRDLAWDMHVKFIEPDAGKS